MQDSLQMVSTLAYMHKNAYLCTKVSNMEVQEVLKEQAIELGLCEKWTDEWGTPDVKQLCDKFIRGLDFCIKHNWPSIEFLCRYFDASEVEKNGIYYIGHKTSVAQMHIIAMGDSIVDVYIPDGKICDIYTRHDSTVNLHVGTNSFVYVSILDKSTVNVVSKGNGGRIKCSYYSGTINNKEQFDTIHDKNQK